METWGEYAGKLQARVWFQENRYRLLELTSTTNLNFSEKFTGKKDGSFEIWTYPVFNSANPNWLTWLTKDDSDQKFVDSFNERMKQLWNDKQKSAKVDSVLETNNPPAIH